MVHKIEIVYDDQLKHMHVNAPLDKELCMQMMGDALKCIAQAGAEKKVVLANGAMPNLRRN